jgi:hypothetical protein
MDKLPDSLRELRLAELRAFGIKVGVPYITDTTDYGACVAMWATHLRRVYDEAGEREVRLHLEGWKAMP